MINSHCDPLRLQNGGSDMGLRFRKSMKIIPGVRLNFSKSGVSASLGTTGARITLSKNGVYSNVGLPGTGVYMRERILKPSGPKSKSASKTSKITKGSEGIFDPYSEAEDANNYIESIINIGYKTPGVNDLISFPRETFDVVEPIFKPASSAIWYPVIWGTVFLILGAAAGPFGSIAGCGIAAWYSRKRIISKHQALFNNTELAQWKAKKRRFEEEQDELQEEFETIMQGAHEDPDRAIEVAFRIIDWPRETNISFEIKNDMVMLDVDLPEIEDMPKVTNVVRGDGARKTVVEEEKSETQRRKDYSRHIHGIGMLLCGTIFNTLDQINIVLISGYSQRLSSADGHIKDEYLYSVKVDRSGWENINLEQIELLDPIEVFGSFDIRRKMTKTGIFKPIEPFEN